MKIIMIAAVGMKRELGYKNQLLWKLSSDLQFFKKMTTGKTIVMGYNTYKSIGKPLPNRQTIVLTQQYAPELKGVLQYHSIESLLEDFKEDTLYVVGGGSVYEQFLPYTEKIYLTIVDHVFPHADTYFPDMGYEWDMRIIDKKQQSEKDEFDHFYSVLERK